MRPADSDAGFTLTELLVVLVLAGGIVAAALHLAVHLMTVNQQQMTRSRLQSDLQRSLDYMAADLEQAVYVYSGDCLGQGTGTGPEGCPGLANHLPAALTPEQERYPLLAFWRRSPLSDTLQRRCRQGKLPEPVCRAQHSYTLVVYLVSTRDEGGIWQGQGRLQRYSLTQFRQSGAAVPGYLDPSRFGHQFASWPWYQGVGTAAPVNQQRGRPTLGGSAPVPLMDFVAATAAGAACPPGHQPTAPAAVLAQLDSLLGCLGVTGGDIGGQQAIALSLRGHLPNQRSQRQVTLHRRVVLRSRLMSPFN